VCLSLDRKLVGGDKIVWPLAFRPVMITVVAIVVALFFAAIDHCDAAGGQSPSSSLGSSNVRGRSSDGCGRSSKGRGWSSAKSIARETGRVHGVAGERAWRLGTLIRRATTMTAAAYNHKSACRCMHIYGIDIVYGIGYLIEIRKLDLAYSIGVVI
jgi:hypothetical protein